MTSPQHQHWINSGLNWRLPAHVQRLRDLLRSKGYTVYDIGNNEHMDHEPPEDHTPYSETGWPGLSPYSVVMALDVMPDGPESLQKLGKRFRDDRNSGRFPSLKYMNWGPNDDSHAIHSSWQPSYAERDSSDTGHIHLSFRTDYVDWNGTYDPWSVDVNLSDVVPLSGKDVGSFDRNVQQILGDLMKFRLWGCGAITAAQAGYPDNSPFGYIEKLAKGTASLVSDAQVKSLAATLAQESDAAVIENALRDVLKKGVDNAG